MHPPNEDVDCAKLFKNVKAPEDHVRRAYMEEAASEKRHACPLPGSFEKHGWCQIVEPVGTRISLLYMTTTVNYT